MSIQAVGAVIDLRGIPPTTKLVLALLANAHNGHTGQCNPDQARLSDEAGISRRSIQDHLGWLEAHGYIARRVTELGRGEGKRTDFDLLFLHRKILPEQPNAPEAERQCSGSSAQLLRKPASGAYKDKPEENRKEPEDAQVRDAVLEAVETIWKAAPQTSRARSGRKPLAVQIRAILKARRDLSAEQLRDAWLEFLRSPDARRDDSKFVPGVHRWFQGGRFEAFLRPAAGARSSDPDDGPPLALIQSFHQYGTGGAWTGRQHGWPTPPDAPEAAGLYPDELYERYGVSRPGRAA